MRSFSSRLSMSRSWLHGHMDGARQAYPAGRLDRQVHPIEVERVRTHQLEWVFLGGDALQGELHRGVAVASAALDGNVLARDLLEREVRYRAADTLNDDPALL